MIILKRLEDIEKIKISCNILKRILKNLYKITDCGISTIELNNRAESLCYHYGAIPAFKDYNGFPYAICASVNSEVLHGFPNNCKLKEGDIVSIDLGVLKNGWYSDAAFTKCIGNDENKLVNTTKKCLELAIEIAVEGNRIGDIGNIIENEANTNGYNILTEFVGHGIGKDLHEDPQIPNYGNCGEGLLLKNGMVVAIEPILVEKSNNVERMPNGWTIQTVDRGLSAHWEHTVAITKKGAIVLT